MHTTAQAGVIVTIMALLASGVPVASAQQNSFTCPITPQANRTIVTFSGSSPLVAHDTLAAALAGPETVTLPAGTYNIIANSQDMHGTRSPVQNQTKEQFYLRLSNGQTTNRISDLPENSSSLTEQIDSNFVISSAVTSVTAQHGEYPAPGAPESIFAVCVAFDNLTPPTPTPTPTPTPGDGKDEPDCCPGPDPIVPSDDDDDEPSVAGATATASPTPQVAGVLTQFPSTGLPVKPMAALVSALLIALVALPARDARVDS